MRKPRHHRRPKARPPAETLRLRIAELGRRGDGIAAHDGRRIYVPFALPGEDVEAEVRGERAEVVRILIPAAERVDPPCPRFGVCGGCAVQHLATASYRAWKHALVTTALAQRGINAPVDDLVDAHGDGRRRVTLHADTAPGGVRVGFRQQRGHRLVAIDACPVLAPDLAEAPDMTARLAAALGDAAGAVDVRWTATETGLDADIRAGGVLDINRQVALAAAADDFDLCRLGLNGDIVVERRAPRLRFGTVDVTPPPGGFLQATAAGEAALCGLVAGHVGPASAVADLFCGVGPFALSLAASAKVLAVDGDAAAIGALEAAVRRASGLKPVDAKVRDLAHDPLLPAELKGLDAVVFDPPRAGAKAQAEALAVSEVPIVVGVSCDPGTFARDAAILIDEGYALARVTPVDQFRYAAHVEIVGLFRRL